MAFKKKLNSDASVIIAGGDQASMFKVGFKYRVADDIYEVIKEFCDNNVQFRRVVGSDGSVEDMTIEAISRDLKQQPNSIETEILKKRDEKIVDEDGKTKDK
jgi:hypothetical protein